VRMSSDQWRSEPKADTSPADDVIIKEDWGPDHRSGYVALLGAPNVGKSTLLNAWLGVKLAPVSPKPQTTRAILRGILTREDAQIIFVDTPGMHRPHSKLGEFMVRATESVIPDADVLVFLVDASRPPDEPDLRLAEALNKVNAPVILALNKVDLISADEFAQREAEYASLGHFEETVGISATEGTHVDALLDLVIRRLPLGPRYYPAEQISDQQERFIAAQMIHEHALRALQQEVPYALAVVVQDFKEQDNGTLYISAYVYTEKESQKGIVIGRGGRMLKQIGRAARTDLEAFFGRKVFLDLWVKVRKNWRRSERDLREFGFDPRDAT